MGQTSAGTVKLCLFRAGREPRANECTTSGSATLTASTASGGSTAWKVTAIGADQDVSPSADLRLDFRALSPTVILDGFRFQGTISPGYNGVVAQFKAKPAGQVAVNGSWAGKSRPWRAQLISVDSGESVASERGLGNDLALTTSVQPGVYRLTLENTQEIADQEVFLHAVISWP